jgi:hypothetical protein
MVIENLKKRSLHGKSAFLKKSGHALYTRLMAEESASCHPHYLIWSRGLDCSLMTSSALDKLQGQSLNLACCSNFETARTGGDVRVFWPQTFPPNF